MQIVKRILIGVGVLAVLFVIIGLSLPKETTVERSIIINAPVGTVFNSINDLKNHEKWDPWQMSDKTMKITYGAVTAGTGASSSWTSEKSGEGVQTITESMTDKSVKLDLDFKKHGTGKAWFKLEATDKGVKVTEGYLNISGKCFCSRYKNLFMDPYIGSQYTKGLKKLKEVCVGEKK
jgi:hypothetical protein